MRSVPSGIFSLGMRKARRRRPWKRVLPFRSGPKLWSSEQNMASFGADRPCGQAWRKRRETVEARGRILPECRSPSVSASWSLSQETETEGAEESGQPFVFLQKLCVRGDRPLGRAFPARRSMEASASMGHVFYGEQAGSTADPASPGEVFFSGNWKGAVGRDRREFGNVRISAGWRYGS